MKRTLLLISLFLITSLTYSCTNKNKKENSPYKSRSKHRGLSTTSDIKLPSIAIERECLESICSPSQLSRDESLKKISQIKLSEYDEKKIEPILDTYKEILELTHKIFTNNYEYYSQTENRKKFHKVGNVEKNILNYLFYKISLLSFANNKKKQFQVFNEQTDKSYQEFLEGKNIPKSIIAKLMNYFRKGLFFAETNLYLSMKDHKSYVSLSRFVPADSIEESIKIIALQIDSFIKYMQTHNIKFLNKSLLEFSKVINKETAKVDQFLIYKELELYFFYRGPIYESSKELDSELSKEILTFIEGKPLPLIDQHIYNTLGSDNNQLESIKSSLSKQLKAMLTYIINTSHSKAKLRAVNKHTLKVKEIIKNTIKLNDVHQQKNFDQFIDEVQVKTQLDRNSTLNTFIKYLENNKSKKLQNRSPKSQMSYLIDSFVDTFTDYLLIDPYQSKYPIIALTSSRFFSWVSPIYFNFLIDSQNEYSSDIFRPMLNVVQLSWNTNRALNEGIIVIAHELAHAVHRYFINMRSNFLIYKGHYNDVFWNEFNCVTGWHIGKPDQPSILSFATEDWADLFAGKIIKEFKKENTWVKNYFCSYFSSDKNYGTTDLNSPNKSFLWRSREELDFLEKNTKQLHSKGLFRLLNLEKHMGNELSPSCQKVVDTNNLFQCPTN